jgi:hypothetical protein
LAKKDGTTLTASDIALNVVSVVLAFFSASFAGYMVMYGPPERNGDPSMVSVALKPFDTSRAKLGKYDILDPIVTGSITKNDGSGKSAQSAALELVQASQHLSYKLRTIVRNTAYVDISNERALVTLPVEVGVPIPGVGNVLRFERRGGKWIVVTHTTEISEAGMIAVR